MGHARVLSKLSDTDQINKLANLIIEEGLSVRETEKLTSAEDMPKKNKNFLKKLFPTKESFFFNQNNAPSINDI